MAVRCVAVILAAAVVGCSEAPKDPVDPVQTELAAFPGWERRPVPAAAGRDLLDLWFRPDGAEGFAVGAGGTVLHYTAEEDWHADPVPVQPTTTWSSVAVSEDGERGFAVGSQGRIAEYTGKNHSWRLRDETLTSELLTSVWLDPAGRFGFAVARGGVVLQWRDERWSRLTLSDLSTNALLDVAANEQKLWVRDSVEVAVFSRDHLQWLGTVPGFDAAKLWSQPPSPGMWVAGVSHLPGKRPRRVQGGLDYSIHWFEAEKRDSVHLIPLLPRAAWMAGESRRGIAAGRIPVDARHDIYLFSSVYVTPGGNFVWPNPDSLPIYGIWTNQDLSDGWAVGGAGLVARLSLRPLTIAGLDAEYGSLENLTGLLTLELDSGVPHPRLDSLRVGGDQHSVTLFGDSGFVDSAHHRQLDLRITDRGRAALTRLKGERVKLRLFLAYPVGATRDYPVAYENATSFVYNKDPFRVPKWAVPVVLAVLVAGFAWWRVPRWRWVRKLLFTPTGQQVLDRTRLKWLSTFISFLLIIRPGFRRRLFEQYRKNLGEEYTQFVYAPPAVELLGCQDLLKRAASEDTSEDRWPLIYGDFRKTKNRVLWVEAAEGSLGHHLLSRLVRIALDHGDTPLLLDLSRSDDPASQIKELWAQHGEIDGSIPEIWREGDFVFLLDASRKDADKARTDKFIQAARRKNLVILCRDTPPSGQGVCHVRLKPGT